MTSCINIGPVLFITPLRITSTSISIQGITDTSEIYSGAFDSYNNSFGFQNNLGYGLTTPIPVNIVDTSGNLIDTISITLTLSGNEIKQCTNTSGATSYTGSISGSSQFCGTIQNANCNIKLYPFFNALTTPINLTNNGVQFSNGKLYSVYIQNLNIY